jgi:T-complex protein 1 subunit theta
MQGVPYSMQSMLKDGHKMLSGLEEAVIKNIEACKQLSTMARTSMGPNGKQIVNRIARDSQDLVLTRASSL